MQLLKIYLKVLSYLGQQKTAACLICSTNIILAIIAIAEPILFGKIIHHIANKSDNNELISSLLYWISFGIFNIISYILVARSADRLAHNCRSKLLSESYQMLLALPLSWHKKHPASDSLHIILRATDSMFSIWLEFMRQHLSTIISLLILIPTALKLNWRLSCVLALLAFIYIMICRLVMQKTQSEQNAIELYHHKLYSHITDTILNINIIQSYNRIKQETIQLKLYLEQLLDAQFPVLNWWALASGLNRMASTLSLVIIISVGALFIIKNQMNVAQLIAFVGFTQLMIGKLDQISAFINLAISSQAKLEQFFSIKSQAEQFQRNTPKMQLSNVKGDIRFENVSFYYPNSTNGIKNISFHIKPGEKVALVGATGCGKTTIINLLQKIYHPQKGDIFIDDINIKNISQDSLYHNIATVFQDSSLLNRSIADNIKIGQENSSLEQIINCAKEAHAHDFILNKQHKYNNIVGEKGNLLSGGERQRLTIARAILKNSPILILDEATSALDINTEYKIKQSLEKIYKNKTCILIAHRLSTIKDVDKILLIDQGEIIEHGSYNQLSQNKASIFAALLEKANIKH